MQAFRVYPAFVPNRLPDWTHPRCWEHQAAGLHGEGTRSAKEDTSAPPTQQTDSEAYVPAYEHRARLPSNASRQKQKDSVNLVFQAVAPRLDCAIDQLRILDVGSGYDVTACALASKCRTVVGIELSQKRVKAARRRAEKAGITNVEFRC
jgi:2-polyprenyl-3-methyl-5-hydroxy-6-metoxy-1,4-benzoquinol methylase